MISDLVDYLHNNLLIAHFCGFDISRPLPSYWTFDRFLKNFDNKVLSKIMKTQVLFLSKEGIVDTSFIGLDSTPVSANTSQNNPKSFLSNKFKPGNQPRGGFRLQTRRPHCINQTNEKKYEFYWGYKNHVLVDCISGLPIYGETFTTAEVHDAAGKLQISFFATHSFQPITDCIFLADKGYDVKNIYNQVKELYNGECIIPLNKRNSKNPKLLPQGNPICEARPYWKNDNSDCGRTRQKFCCPLKSSKDTLCPCHHKNFYNGKKHRGCTKYLTIPSDLRLSIDRDSKYFKSNYSLRTECERYNSRFKNTGQERMWVRNKASVTNLNTLAHISLLAVAVAAITSHSGQSYRKLKTIKRIA